MKTQNSFQWPQGRRAAVSFSFDDARLSQADNGLPILDEHGVKATFYVSFGTLEERLDKWRAALESGHEIGNHTLTHPCSGNFGWGVDNVLEEYSLSRMEDELLKANEKIQTLLGITPTTFAYPCGQKFVGRGENLHSYVPLVARHFRAGRGFRDEYFNDPMFCDLAQLGGMDGDDTPFENWQPLLDAIRESGRWLILCGHHVGKSGHQTVRADALDSLCRYAQDERNEVWMDTVANIAQYVHTTRQV